MPYKHLILAATACFVFATGFTRCGHRHDGQVNVERMERRVLSHVEDFADDLDATDTQQEQLATVARGLIAEVPPIVAAHYSAKKEMQSAWRSEKPNAERLHNLVDERGQAILGFAHKLVNAGLEIHRILTPEQRQEVTEEFGWDE